MNISNRTRKRIPTWDYIIEENLKENILAEKFLSDYAFLFLLGQ